MSTKNHEPRSCTLLQRLLCTTMTMTNQALDGKQGSATQCAELGHRPKLQILLRIEETKP